MGENETGERMTKADRQALLGLLKRREQVAKAAAVARSAELLADAEAKLTAEYSYLDDEVWRQVYGTLATLKAEADARVAARCAELGIPKNFAPSISMSWSTRGENGWKDRQQELRRAAKAEIAAREKKALAAVEAGSVEAQAALLTGSMDTAAAERALAAMPSPTALMPPLTVEEVKALRPGPAETDRYGLASSDSYQRERDLGTFAAAAVRAAEALLPAGREESS